MLPPAIIIVLSEIPVVPPIPMVVVLPVSRIAVPIPGEVAASLVSRGDPAGRMVRRAGPITGVPLIVVSPRIPVALDPDKPWAGMRWQNPNYAQRRRCTDLDSYGNLGECGCC